MERLDENALIPDIFHLLKPLFALPFDNVAFGTSIGFAALLRAARPVLAILTSISE